MEIVGKDFCFNVDDRDLVRIAMSQLRNAGEKITLQSVSQVSGLNVQVVKTILLEMKADHEKAQQ